ncbi:lipid IV(A) 3-deoxy-D-manno-octulosonic acid transferase [Solemya velesiana gill symbiont]|uniref:3-deoxy-D-manno-octulosonic acid transferase n=1 Tax=Solemya velesiana gill symbiont TaxID=1918948 RepID=A0A1T2KY29_9GAMM|nr:lipid IV(A) 3-deoxy-D-manno-octulosonic acid transferase [Solemya velesiana gill symbiont]OOZ37670.1 3-deoxy-D-manno-octulosonic acid transferase [Solemya velesiana gill symbiont]
MHFIYSFILLISLPFFLLRLLLRGVRSPAYLKRWKERLGYYDAIDVKNSIWIHSVSVGEAQAAEPMVRQLQERYPDVPIVITTTTPTGSDRVKKLFGESVYHAYFPYDLPFSINVFLRRTNPCLLVMMETEIWPNLLAICEKKQIPTILANARLSEKSARGYSRFGTFARKTFGRIGTVAAQAPADAERFLGLGVPTDAVRVTGSVKFDIRMPASLYEQADVLRRWWGERPIWVAASTHNGEDELVLEAHRQVCEVCQDALLVLVPRHPERFDRVADLSRKSGFNVSRRSLNEPCESSVDVFLGDTMGELPLFLAASDAAFVGGSLVPTGGHNVLEPAALGVPVAFGPSMYNFSIISQQLLLEKAAVQVADEIELAEIMTEWLSDASERARIGEKGRAVVEANRGALDRLMVVIEEQLTEGACG